MVSSNDLNKIPTLKRNSTTDLSTIKNQLKSPSSKDLENLTPSRKGLLQVNNNTPDYK